MSVTPIKGDAMTVSLGRSEPITTTPFMNAITKASTPECTVVFPGKPVVAAFINRYIEGVGRVGHDRVQGSEAHGADLVEAHNRGHGHGRGHNQGAGMSILAYVASINIGVMDKIGSWHGVLQLRHIAPFKYHFLWAVRALEALLQSKRWLKIKPEGWIYPRVNLKYHLAAESTRRQYTH
jgi:hypothetical protein